MNDTQTVAEKQVKSLEDGYKQKLAIVEDQLRREQSRYAKCSAEHEALKARVNGAIASVEKRTPSEDMTQWEVRAILVGLKG